MESYGCAKTVRNDNSSRFGKLVVVSFERASISGATIVNYLLERTRLSRVPPGERNFHVRYHLALTST